MTASSLLQTTVMFDDPTWASTPGVVKFIPLSTNVSLPAVSTSRIQTLSSTVSVAGQDVTGLLYTPDLNPNDSCYNASAPYVPQNATRQGSLPNQNFDLIGVAPWLSPACTLAYLEAARSDPINGFIFFVPDANDTGTPAGPDDPRWDLGDGGAWKSTNKYPVYVISGAVGSVLMARSALYSGNVTSVPFGRLLAGAYDPQLYVRLYLTVSLDTPSHLPPLWAFLIIVIGILLAIIGVTILIMHYLQLRQRRSLRRRIVDGEVDLEALGIQRLIVPQELLDRMPIFEFGTGKPFATTEKQMPSLARHDGLDEKTCASQTSETTQRSSQDLLSTATSLPRFRNHINQPTCAICLDDFLTPRNDEPGSAVRQLPCHHIFHPECVDSFLRENSSLCPMCKSSALPKGYCPKVITNAMVRRERTIRRMRERLGSAEPETLRSHQPGRLARMRARLPTSRRAEREGDEEMTGAQPEEMISAGHSNTTTTPPPLHSPRRPEWAQRRALAMLGRRQAFEQAQTNDRPSRWKKIFGGVVPGIE